MLIGSILCFLGNVWAAHVPEDLQCRLDKCSWLMPNSTFAYGNNNNWETPEMLGRIEEEKIIWKKRVYDISSFTVDNKKTMTIVFAEGTLVLRYNSKNAREGTFTPVNSEYSTTFRTGGLW